MPPRRVGLFFRLALALPVLGYVSFIGVAEAERWGAASVEVRIEGYDPRDPLRGHYLNYRIEVEGGDHVHRGSSACAGPPVDGLSPVWVDERARPDDCVHELSTEFVLGDHRFYVQQTGARQLERAVRDGRASAVLLLLGDGRIVVDELRVDGQPIR